MRKLNKFEFGATGTRSVKVRQAYMVAHTNYGVTCYTQTDSRVVLDKSIRHDAETPIHNRHVVFLDKYEALRYCAHVTHEEPYLNLVLVLVYIPTHVVYNAKHNTYLRGHIERIKAAFASEIVPIEVTDINVGKSVKYKRELRLIEELGTYQYF